MFRDVPGCSGMFRNVPGCSMFLVLSTPRFTLYHELLCCVQAVNTLFLMGWENLNQASCQQDVKMSLRGRQLKRPRIRAGGFYFSRGFADRVPGSYKTAMLRRLRIMENYHAFISDIVFQHVIKSDHHTLHVAVILFWKEQR